MKFFLILFFAFSCKTKTEAQLDFDSEAAQAVGEATAAMPLPDRIEICKKSTTLIFIGNAEHQGVERYIDPKLLTNEEKAQSDRMHADFFGSVKLAEQELVKSLETKIMDRRLCPQGGGRFQFLSVIDGPGDKDTVWTKVIDRKKSVESGSELSMPDIGAALKSHLDTMPPSDHYVVIIKTHGGRMKLGAKDVQMILFDDHGERGQQLSNIYYHRLYTYAAHRALCSDPKRNPQFCEEHQIFDPRLSGVGGNSSGVGGNSSGVGGNSSGVGGNSSGVGGNGSGVGGNGSGVEGNGSGVRAEQGDLVIGAIPFDNQRFSAEPSVDKAQGSLQLGRAAFYGVGLTPEDRAKLVQAGVRPFELELPESKQPLMVILDSCVQSGTSFNAMKQTILGQSGPLVTFSSRNPIYYYGIQYHFLTLELLRFLPFLAVKPEPHPAIRGMGQRMLNNGMSQQGVAKAYGDDQIPKFKQAHLTVCMDVNCTSLNK